MRICVHGTGSIGGNFATRLADAGNEVSVNLCGSALCLILREATTVLGDPMMNAGIATPTLDAIEAFAVSMAASKGLYVP